MLSLGGAAPREIVLFSVGIQTNKKAVSLSSWSLLIAHFSDLGPSSLF